MELRPNVAVGHVLHWTDDLDGARVLLRAGIRPGGGRKASRQASRSCCGPWPRTRAGPVTGRGPSSWRRKVTAWPRIPAARRRSRSCRRRADSCTPTAAGSTLACATRRARWNSPGTSGMPLLAAMAAQPFGIAALSAGTPRAPTQRLGPLAEAVLAAGMAEPAAVPVRSRRDRGAHPAGLSWRGRGPARPVRGPVGSAGPGMGHRHRAAVPGPAAGRPRRPRRRRGRAGVRR